MSNFMIALKRKGIKMEQSDMLSELSVKLVMACQERDKFRAQIDAVLKACRKDANLAVVKQHDHNS